MISKHQHNQEEERGKEHNKEEEEEEHKDFCFAFDSPLFSFDAVISVFIFRAQN